MTYASGSKPGRSVRLDVYPDGGKGRLILGRKIPDIYTVIKGLAQANLPLVSWVRIRHMPVK
jgi:hypothetical protein